MGIVVGKVDAPSTIYSNDSDRHFTPIHFGDNKGLSTASPSQTLIGMAFQTIVAA